MATIRPPLPSRIGQALRLGEQARDVRVRRPGSRREGRLMLCDPVEARVAQFGASIRADAHSGNGPDRHDLPCCGSAVPGSAIFRCCFARTAAGVTFATADWILFLMPVTTSPSPRIMAS